MTEHARRLINNQRLIKAAHWISFGLGALSLAVAVGGTVWTALLA